MPELELMDDKRAMLIERIKNAIVENGPSYGGRAGKWIFSDHLSKKLDHDYTYMANLFSEVQGTTIEQHIIAHKIERIKELIIYGELNITEIAWKMELQQRCSPCRINSKRWPGSHPSSFQADEG